MYTPEGSLDAQGNDLQIGTNCLGHYLLYQLLVPLLTKAAAEAPTASVRVAWAASIAVHVASPKPAGIIVEADGRPTDQGISDNYGQSKVGNVFLAREMAKSTPETGIVHVAFNPGNLRTELQRHWTGVGHWITVSINSGSSGSPLWQTLTLSLRTSRTSFFCTSPSMVLTPNSSLRFRPRLHQTRLGHMCTRGVGLALSPLASRTP